MLVTEDPKVNKIAILTLREVTVHRCEPTLAQQLGSFNEVNNYKEYWLRGSGSFHGGKDTQAEMYSIPSIG